MTDPIITRITDYLKRYMVFPSEREPFALALWVLHTWTFSESFPRLPFTTPYIYIHAPTKQSGKTLLLDLLEPLVRNPERSVDMTPSSLFRLIEAVNPTIMLDEADAIWNGARNEALRGIVNGGYKQGGYVWRTDGLEPTKFSLFGPKVFAGIDNGLLPDTVRDRCIPITLRKKMDSEVRDVWYEYKTRAETTALVEEIIEWVTAHGERISDYDPEPGPAPLVSRPWEIAMPLIQIAHVARCEKLAREALGELLTPPPEKLSPEAELLGKIRDLFDSTGQDVLFSAEVCAALGSGWNGKLLGNKLRPFGIGTGVKRRGNKTLNGFIRADFEDAWKRYLSE